MNRTLREVHSPVEEVGGSPSASVIPAVFDLRRKNDTEHSLLVLTKPLRKGTRMTPTLLCTMSLD